MKYQQEVHNISNLKYFQNYIKKEAINTFLVTFHNTKEFINIFEDSLITDTMVAFELR